MIIEEVSSQHIKNLMKQQQYSGNSMFSMAVEVLTKNTNNQNHKRSLEIINLLTRIAGTNGLALGQSLDLEIPKKISQKIK